MIDFNKLTLPINDKFQLEVNHFGKSKNSNLFNEKLYFLLHADSTNDLFIQLVRITDSKVYATISFYQINKSLFTSPKHGTFGGIVVNEPTSMILIDQFIGIALSYIKKLGANTISIKCPPFSHDPSLTAIITNVLIRREFIISGYELNYDMRVDKRPFFSRIDHGNNKRIRKCLREGFFADQVDFDKLPEIYKAIKENREKQGFPISMTLGQLYEMASIFPNKIHLFGIYKDTHRSVVLASAICIALTDSILYVFYWGDVPGYESYSPVTMLASTIYDFCQKKGFEIMDIGVSTISGVPNYGLVKFKHNLGFSESLKLSFIWEKK